MAGTVRHIVLDNPPVNGLGFEVRQWLFEQVRSAQDDDGVAAIVLRGAGRMFCGGADIRQFGTPKVAMQPLMRDVNRHVESARKPVVAALHGHALGGGLELAMACHARVATRSTVLGLPEVTLGIVPGGGGTQRLQRLVGTPRAVDWIVSGRRLTAEDDQASGLVDQLVGEDALLAAAEALALELAAQPSGRLAALAARARPLSLTRAEADRFFESRRGELAKASPDRQAPLAALRCVAAAYEMPFEEALTVERVTFLELVEGEEATRARAAFARR